MAPRVLPDYCILYFVPQERNKPEMCQLKLNALFLRNDISVTFHKVKLQFVKFIKTS